MSLHEILQLLGPILVHSMCACRLDLGNLVISSLDSGSGIVQLRSISALEPSQRDRPTALCS